ncbi:ran GTPase-activating protein 1 [Prorops nasuta]|uniref:ran GTPase-activating protein 1 n=1 Tax=Prorops nasuta TaxID=863751 RepID=UPI0034CDDA31
MSSFNLSELQNTLSEASQTKPKIGVSFALKSLQFHNEDDVKPVVEAIRICECLQYLDLEGNSLGPDAAKAIAEALKEKGEPLERALWKDMFTGRLKAEIPKALEYLGDALCFAKTRLIELDLSDNALGPIGVQGLAKFLASSPCYTLKELRLNNTGLGISGGKMLASALLDCHANSIKDGCSPLALKVFVAGRNRLENEGSEALASVFEKLTSLEEVVMPQNGIYYVGITALAKGLSANSRLRILNLNDNTLGLKGAKALAGALPNFPCLEQLNLGDCLLKTTGSLLLAKALGIKNNHPMLKELILENNEIYTRAADFIAQAMADKSELMSLQLDGNFFGTEGRSILRNILQSFNKIDSLGGLDEDATDDDESDKDESDRDESKEETSEDENEDDVSSENTEQKINVSRKEITIEDFLKCPTGDNLLLLQGDDAQLFVAHVKSLVENLDAKFIDEFTRTIMKVSSLCDSGYIDVRTKAENLTDALYKELFENAVKYQQISNLNNALLVNLGLLKSEDKHAGRIDWNLEGCFKALEKVCQGKYFLPETKDTLKVFLEKPVKISRAKVVDPFQESKNSLKSVLDGIQIT